MNDDSGVFVGTYAESGGKGVYPVRIGNGLALDEPLVAAPNASFAAYDAGRRLLHLVDEQDRGLLRSFRIGPCVWEFAAEHETGGAAPCYVALDAQRTRLAVANYGSGSLALFALGDDGLPSGPPQTWQSHGSGPVADRQEAAHLHCALFGDARLYVVDLGSDRIFAFDPEQGLAKPSIAYQAPPGSGPRHLVLHPNLPLAYLVSELAATVTILTREGGRLMPRATLATAPEDFRGHNLGGHISLGHDATRLYVTNRGHDSLAVFTVAADGALTPCQHVSSGGASPRCFALIEDAGICLVANEEGQNLVALPIDGDGLLGQASSQIAVPGAAYPFALGRL